MTDPFARPSRLLRALAGLGLGLALASARPGALPSAAASPALVHPPELEPSTPEEEEDEAADVPVIAAPEPEPEPEPRKRAASKKPGAKDKKPEKSQSRKPRGDKACDFRTPIWEHTVREGETLSQIAASYGVRVKDIKKLDAKVRAKPDSLRIGQKIKVCPDIAPHQLEEETYTVRKGDSLSEIGEKFAMTPKQIIAMQNRSLRERLQKSPKDLRIGEELIVLVDRGVVAAFAPPDEDKGVLRIGVQLLPGKHYYIKRPHLAYGTAAAIKAITAAISRYAQVKGVKGGPQIHVGDISARGGGPLKGHKSHQKGVDVDIGLVLKGADASEVRFLTGNADNLDIARTWALIKAFVDASEVRAIFLDYGLQKLLYEHAKKKGVAESTLDELFQYPRGKGRNFGIIRHWKGHRDHFHVRFRR